MYDYKISNIRAIAIIIVVLGHSIIIYSTSWNFIETKVDCILFAYLKDIINIFQMQLFFLISGYLFYNNIKKGVPFHIIIVNKIKRLIIPYLIVGLLWMIPIKCLLGVPSYRDVDSFNMIVSFIIGTNNGHLWFLYALFGTFVISTLLCKRVNMGKWGGQFFASLLQYR